MVLSFATTDNAVAISGCEESTTGVCSGSDALGAQ